MCDDPDADGLIDTLDNCPDAANADQTDSDLDGSGDVCDEDIDGDGVENGSDPCPYIAGQLVSYNAGAIDFAGSYNLAGEFVSRDYVAAPGNRFHWSVDVNQSGAVDADERDDGGYPLKIGDVARSKHLDLEYDSRGRLESAKGANLRGYQDCSWRYDDVGSRDRETCYGKQIEYSIDPDGNELLSRSYTTAPGSNSCGEANEVVELFHRDVLGRQQNTFSGRFTQEGEEFSLNYGPDSRLVSAVTSDGHTSYEYVYDHRMLRCRTSKVDSLTGVLATRDTVYSSNGLLLSEKKAGNGALYEYIWLAGVPVALVVDDDGDGPNPGSVFALGVDHLGAPHRAWDTDSGETVWAGDYEAFGRCTSWSPSNTTGIHIDVSLRFPGQLDDQETGLHYNHWRYYEPESGRYLTADPLGLFGGDASLFSYGSSAPTLFTDPTGQLFKYVNSTEWEILLDLTTVPGIGENVTELITSPKVEIKVIQSEFRNGGSASSREWLRGRKPPSPLQQRLTFDRWKANSELIKDQRVDLPQFSTDGELVAHELGHLWAWYWSWIQNNRCAYNDRQARDMESVGWENAVRLRNGSPLRTGHN